MYTKDFVAGHVTTGLTADATRWGFAEGVEHGHYGTFFRTFYLFANSTATPAAITGTFYREDGTGIVRSFAIGPNSRFTLPASFYPALSNQKFAAFFESTNGTPVIVERAVYWDDSFFGAHASPGTPWPTGAIAVPPAPPAATTTTIVPTAGADTGGTAVTLTGTNYSAGATVSIGGVAATGVTVVSATTITATAGPHTPGTVDVVVTSNGTASTLAGGFTYAVSASTTTAIVPTAGADTGGTVVTLTGTNYSAGATVSIGGVAATSVTVVSPTTITAITGPHAAGTVDVTVTSNGTASALVGGFTYVTPITITLTDNVLAFGDSITFGTTTFKVPVGLTTTLYTAGFTTPYTQVLEAMLRARYPSQAITVQNAGVPGEDAFDGQFRLPGTLTAAHDLMVLLQGVNDTVTGFSTSEIAATLTNMVRTAKNAGKLVILCTLTPVFVGDTGIFKSDPVAVAALNAVIPGIAASEGAILVDVEAAFGNNSALMSPDGLHPNDLGYQVMAQAVFNAIVANFEITTTPSP